MGNSFTDALEDLDRAAKTSKASDDAKKAISQARVKLLMGKDAKYVFFSTVAMKLKMVEDTSIPTAATDGKRILYNPEFMTGLSKEELVGVFVHEVLHVTNAHHARMGARNPRAWNVAADLAINPIVLECGFKIPQGGLFPGQGQFADMPAGLSAEEYYNLLPKIWQEGSDLDPGGAGGVMQPGDGSPAAQRSAEAEAKVMAAQAQQAAKMTNRGTLPGSIDRSVNEMLEPKADWKSILREFVSRTAKNDYSWARPNRRYISQGVYLPGLHSEELGDVAILVDLSGSITPELLKEFSAELNGIFEAYDCELTIIYHDIPVTKVETWKSADGPLALSAPGGGGTSHKPAFEYVEKSGLNPACMISFTDMASDFPDVAPDYPVLFAKYGSYSAAAPFGRLIQIE
jgi:predicted metal-dependent peptidase